MTKRLSLVSILIILIFGTSSITLAASSPQDNISKNKMIFQQMDESIINTNKQISDLNAQMNNLNKSIGKNNVDIKECENQIKVSNAQMEQLKEEIDSKQEFANTRLRAMYMNGYTEDFLGLLLSSESFSDFLYRYEAMRKIISFDKDLLMDLEVKKKALSENINNLSIKNEKLKELQSTNATSLQQLNDERDKLQILVKLFNQEKQSASVIIKENEEKLIAHAILVINLPSSTLNDIKSAVETLKSLSPQLSTDSVKKEAQAYIDSGNKRIAAMSAQSSNPGNSGGDIYKATFSMTATAYNGGNLTAIGLKPVRDSSGLSTIAVDPTVIPLGSKVYIPGYGYAICSDTGGAIKGNIIDLYMNSVEECFAWGRRTVTLYIIAYPGEW